MEYMCTSQGKGAEPVSSQGGVVVWSHRPEVLQEDRGFAGNSLLLLPLLDSDSLMEVM